ncbi:MAG: SUF system NifU family Fe-S cluster assembly protein [Erysipelotrichales bacterium]|nr:SUF system NifU family Fe-S cluster assembly protein [Erysipelotrichales bacterium]
MNDIENLYRAVIMDHYKNPKNKGLVENSSYLKVHLNNPSCGDDIHVQLCLEDDQIKDIRHDGTGCSICCSSASIMSQTLKGQKTKKAKYIIRNFYELLKGTDKIDEDALEEAIVYKGVAKFPARIKCASLSWKALESLIEDADEEKN